MEELQAGDMVRITYAAREDSLGHCPVVFATIRRVYRKINRVAIRTHSANGFMPFEEFCRLSLVDLSDPGIEIEKTIQGKGR